MKREISLLDHQVLKFYLTQYGRSMVGWGIYLMFLLKIFSYVISLLTSVVDGA